MRRLFITPILWLALALSAYGMSMEFPVTPSNSDEIKHDAHYRYLFTVSTKATKDGVDFHVTITAKEGDIPSDAVNVSFSIVKETQEGGSMGPDANTNIPVKLKKNKQVWEADFSVSRAAFERSRPLFVFSEELYAIINGKREPMDSAKYVRD